jgi:hypothetical protein
MTSLKNKRVMSLPRQGGKSHLTTYQLKRMMDDMLNRPVEELVLDTGRVYGALYYTVKPVGGSWLEMEHWAIEVYGKPGSDMWGNDQDRNIFAPEADARWYMNNSKFWFRREQDRTMFILRWR